MRVPSEPIYQGKPLSQWFTDGSERLTGTQLRTLGPGAIKWLTYQAAQSRLWNPDDVPSDASLFTRLELWTHGKLHDDPLTKRDIVNFEAIEALEALGPDAASAVPALIKVVRDGDNDNRLTAPNALAAIGPASWPAVSEAIRHGTHRQRLVLIMKLPVRFSEIAPPQSGAEFSEMLALLLSMVHDPDPYIRGYAGSALKKCVEVRRGSPEFAAGIRAGAGELAHLPNEERKFIADVFSGLGLDAVASAPALEALVDIGNRMTRAHILGALAVVEPDNPRWPALLHEGVASPDKELSSFSEDALIRAGR
ncbi:MAG: hypothetical protein QOE70_1617 [Chthoniobacter sp.]|jgi:HEAT repeat protein|nr:hypothetical protein [Chthoniobacter sp.]